jgi:hypothetical protein
VMHLATLVDRDNARGYLASEDRGFVIIERHPAWAPRAGVLILTHAIPELAEFVCGETIPDAEVVRLLFEPAIATAAHLMSEEIRELTAVGVDLRKTYLDRLDWDLRTGLQESVRGFSASKGRGEAEQQEGALAVVKTARERGYPLEPRIQRVVDSYDAAIEELEAERARRAGAESKIVRLARAAAGGTKRGRRRVNAVLRELGLELDRLEDTAGNAPE